MSTSEGANDPDHYVAAWTWDRREGKGPGGPKSKAQAMAELVEVVRRETPDGFQPNVVAQTDEYLYAEYTSPTFGFVDDVEFWLKDNSQVEYRSASRIGESDGKVNRKRIRALRLALQDKGWASLAQLE